MSLYIDHNFIAQAGSRLEKFKRKSQKAYNFRCPFCGDSQKSKTKARGYFYYKEGGMFFCCHNCLKNWSLGHFLKEFDADLYKEYIFERYTKGETGHNNYEKPKFTFQWKRPGQGGAKPEEKSKEDSSSGILSDYETIAKLSDDHAAVKYIKKRQIPESFHSDLYYVPDFKKLVDTLEPDNEYGLMDNDKRIVIPFYDTERKIIAIQGRALGISKLRYITIKLDKDAPKLFGIDKVNPDEKVYILEGPIDSMFIPNAIATAGAKLGSSDLDMFRNRVFVYDNERRKKEIVDAMVKRAADGEKVCVWPDTIQENDVNNMILAGRTAKNIIDIIDENTYTGLSAEIAITEWRRC